MPTAFRHDLFLLRNGPKMLAHTFRGPWRSVCGLESSREVFARYRAIRAEERNTWTCQTRRRQRTKGRDPALCLELFH